MKAVKKTHEKVKIPSLVKLASQKASEQFNNGYALPDDNQVTHITSLTTDAIVNLFPFLHFRWVFVVDSFSKYAA